MTAMIPRARKLARCERAEYALSARSETGVVRGLPGPSRAMLSSANSFGSAGESLAWPGVTAMTSGSPLPSTSAWVLVVKPPRERPIA